MRGGYALLLAYHQSGQMSERQWQEHLKDEVFSAWLKRADHSSAPRKS